jgi:small subunit ribosomal protein S9
MSKAEPIQTTGRRKTSVASIRLQPGSGAIKVNGRDFTDYFPSLSVQNQILRPLEIANAVHTYDLTVRTVGGGVNGQAGALRLAISRALIEIDEALLMELSSTAGSENFEPVQRAVDSFDFEAALKALDTLKLALKHSVTA